MSCAVISSRAVKRLHGGHLWIYASDVLRVEATGGDVVAVVDERGSLLGYAFYSDASQITLRWVAPSGPEPDEAFWRRRLEVAHAYRSVVVADTDAYRVVHGEGDLLPSLVVDRYGDYLVLQTLSQGSERLKTLWVTLLREMFNPAAIVERNDSPVRAYEQLPAVKGTLFGEDPGEIPFTMNGVRLLANPLTGQKTGAFLDQRENYAAAARYAHGRALDAFCYAGGFALHLAPHVESVLAVDISEDAAALARRNVACAGAENVEVRVANVFDYLRELERAGERFDTLVLDPPAFAKNKASLAGAYRGYKEINLRALKLLRTGGVLLTCSCSFHMGGDLFLQMLAEAAADAGRALRIVEIRGGARDHPTLLGVPETAYLKCVVAEVLN